ncbi:GNAT family N-acetyltransferase [Calditrichota bacterium GD2]
MNIDKIKIRKARLEDAGILYELANDIEVRKNSINKNVISWEKHISWLKNKILNKNYYIFLFFKDDQFVGQVRFFKEKREAHISISLHPSFRGKGISKILLDKGIKKLLFSENTIERIVALIRPSNLPSIKSFLSIGFQYNKEVKINNEKFYKYVLYVNENFKL